MSDARRAHWMLRLAEAEERITGIAADAAAQGRTISACSLSCEPSDANRLAFWETRKREAQAILDALDAQAKLIQRLADKRSSVCSRRAG